MQHTNNLNENKARSVGSLSARILYAPKPRLKAAFSFKQVTEFGYPQRGLSPAVNDWRESNWFANLREAAWRLRAVATLRGLMPSSDISMFSQLFASRFDGETGQRLDLGLASLRVVTDTGVAFIVDAWQNSLELEIMKYHGVGVGTGNEAASDTALGTESTTALNPDSTRATGSLTEGATGNIFRTVGTVTFDATAAITEHGIFSQAATGGGTLFDRSKFSAINVVSGDSISFTYDLTIASGN